jgi:demethylmenaquinone methyltransferase/2-methoxy-6-polyprenyl-1,4-benzoquinol methylase
MGKDPADFPLKDFYSDIHPTYDRVNRVFTFGRDRHWRKLAARWCLDADPDKVLDLCTGTGDFAFEVARQAGEGIEITGYDFSEEMLQEARIKQKKQEGKRIGIPVNFVRGDVRQMPFKEGHFDAIGITFGLRNLVYENSAATKHMEEIRRVLRQDGQLTVLESSNPSNGLWRFFNTLYLNLILPYLGGILSGNFKAYRYLATSSRNYYSIREMEQLLEQAGFRVVSSRPLFLGSVMLVAAVKK